MKITITEQTKSTPEIVLDYDRGVLKIKGNSFSLDSNIFWLSVLDKIGRLINHIDEIEIELVYVNSNSISHIFKLINFKKINVSWIYDESDEDMYELGKDLESISKSSFNFYPIVNEFNFNSMEYCV